MFDLVQAGEQIAQRRREIGITQADLAQRSGIGRSTLAALERGKLGELGISKIIMVLAVLGLELRVGPLKQRRPTLDELREENERDAEGLD